MAPTTSHLFLLSGIPGLEESCIWISIPLGIIRIEFHGCLAQMFFFHTFSSTESAILLAMAFDSFVAICNPLSYTVVLMHSCIIQMGLAAVARGVALVAPLPILLKRLPFCKNIILTHSFCFHPDVLKLACASIRVTIIYGRALILCSFGVDSVFIVLSYTLILKKFWALLPGKDGLRHSTHASPILSLSSFSMSHLLSYP
ncbi:olfactory receptor 51I1-like [Ailuropoda melanoleuca]|uniref:olfactory receptor 51I1-like n=1 Tax=Ailuropoda melanoleuca TaxID=9646 RepID=UPI0014947DED|nr:olfactory receptor 51I1-like [Ailuropoda melanoleuca]